MYCILKISRKLKEKYFFLSFLTFSILYSSTLFPNSVEIQKQLTNQNCQKNQECKAKEAISLFNSSGENIKNNLEKKKNIQLAQSGRCPISMPYMATPIVFQSVEAPQIEPMNEQANFPYNDYDLVMGKAAGVLIHIRPGRMDNNHSFILDLSIRGEKGYISRCFHSPFNSKMSDKDNKEFCSFNRKSLRNKGYYKFIPLPMESTLNKEGFFTITATILPQGYHEYSDCLKNNRTFRIRVIATEDLELSFTRIYGGSKCREVYDRNTRQYNPHTGYRPVSFDKIKDFALSDEVYYNITAMFPVKEVVSQPLRYRYS